VWQDNFDNSLTMGAGAQTPVPEPAALAIFAMFILPIALRRQCSTSRA
jgi:hypothetical protein